MLFDSDGVLVDSDASVYRAWAAWAERYGLDADTVVGSVHGRLVGEIVATLLPEAEQAEGLRTIIELERADAESCTAIPGAMDLLSAMGTLPFAIVTSGESVLARARLAAAGIPVPPVLVTGDDVERGKPDPEPYRLAAARLGVPVEACVVVEDSPAGVQSARAAGAGGVLGVGPRAAELDVDATVPDLRGVVVDEAGVLVPAPRPVVLLCPAPQSVANIFSAEALALLHERYDVREVLDPADPAIDALLPECFAVVGQVDLPRSRVEAAPLLRAVLNVEGNFYPNVDYAACFERGIPVLACGPAYAQSVAEFALGLALDLARGISREDRAFRRGEERYLAAGNGDAILLSEARIGLLGVGNLGRALLPLLRPFGARLLAHDPWLPDSVLRAEGLEPQSLSGLLSNVDVLFVLASTTTQNSGLLDGAALSLLPDGARVVLVSRAAIMDFDALLAEVRAGRLYAAVDVWPQEPTAAGEPLREEDNVVLSAHRAGALTSAFRLIGEMVLDDLAQVERGLPPVRMQVAARELVTRYRNKPADHPQA